MTAVPLLEIRAVEKTFGPVRALAGVDLTARRGEVHALVGENGAGKSTLMKILAGVHPADRGTILLDGQPYRPADPAAARRHGVAMIYQELNLAPHLTVEENVTLGLETTVAGFLRHRRAEVSAALRRLGHGEIDPRTPVGRLGIGAQQVVEIARALVSRAGLVIMDEPTSSLSATDTEALFSVIRRLRGDGLAVIYISHFLEEIRRVADRYTVLRDGRTVAAGSMASATPRVLAEAMIGRPLTEMFPRVPHAIGETVLEVKGLCASDGPRNVDLVLRRGEILGLAGLVGAGRSETIRALFGLHPVSGGTFRLRDAPARRVRWITPARALRAGMDLLSENRKEEGLATHLPIRLNVALSSLRRLGRWGFLRARTERRHAAPWMRRLAVRCRDADQPVGALSGGNQQKVALARLLADESEILFLDEPTRGIDIGSKQEICRLIGELAANGKAVVVVSSYLPELLGVCDTLAVMHRGRLAPPRPVHAWTEAEIMLQATSGSPSA